MRRYSWVLLGLVLFAGRAVADDAPRKILKETWDAAYIQGVKSGYLHTTVREVERDGQKVLATTIDLELKIRRYDAVVALRMTTGTEETAAGKTVGVLMIQDLGMGQKLTLTGKAKGEQLNVDIVKPDGTRMQRQVPWNDRVLGIQGQQRIFQDMKAEPGDRFSYTSFEPQLNSPVTHRVYVKGKEEVELLGVKKTLLRVETTPDKIEGPGGTSVQLPGESAWLNADLVPVRTQAEMPGLGKIVFYRTTRELAVKAGGVLPQNSDIGLASLIKLDRAIRDPHTTTSAVYRITVKGETDPGSTFARDARQQVKNVKGDTFELHVRGSTGPKVVEKPNAKAGDEFLKSNVYITSDDPTVKELARQCIGAETNAWKKAKLIERWVYQNIREKNFRTAFCPASQVAKNLQGDCRQHAVLTAAMCRAAGIPSRTAVGLIYFDDREGKPMMGFHMWTEVWIQGQWLPIDATLGLGRVGAAHLKISDSSWDGVESLTPFLPVIRVLSKLKIEMVSASGE